MLSLCGLDTFSGMTTNSCDIIEGKMLDKATRGQCDFRFDLFFSFSYPVIF